MKTSLETGWIRSFCPNSAVIFNLASYRAQTELDILKRDYLKDSIEPQVISNFVFVRIIKLDQRKG